MNNVISLHGRCQKSRGKGRGEWGKRNTGSFSLFPVALLLLPSPPFACVCHTGYNVMHAKQGPVPERSINANPGLKFCSVVV